MDYATIPLIMTTALSIIISVAGVNHKVNKEKVSKLLSDFIDLSRMIKCLKTTANGLRLMQKGFFRKLSV